MHIANVVTAWVLAAHDELDDAAHEVGLDPRSLAALTLVFEHDGRSVEWLRSRVGLTQSGTVRLVDRLVAGGWLSRARSDGRTVALSVTDAGIAVLRRWHQARDGAVRRSLVGLDADQRNAVARSLARSLATPQRRRREADATCRRCDWDACGDRCPVAASVTSEE